MSIRVDERPIADTCDAVLHNDVEMAIVRVDGVEIWNCAVAACPIEPSGVTLTETASYTLLLEWFPVTGAASYNVYNAVGDVLLGNTTDAFYDYTAGTPGDTTTLYVTTVPTDTANCSETGPSDAPSAVYPTPPAVCPVAPTGLTGSAAGLNVNTNWDDMDYKTGYNVYADGTLQASNVQTSDNVWTAPAFSTTYAMTVASIPDDVPGCGSEGPMSAPVNVTTASAPPPIPGPPTSITAEDCTTDGDINISYTGPGPSFRLTRDNFFLYSGSSTAYNDTTAVPGTIYQYKVYCFNSSGESAGISDSGNKRPGAVSSISHETGTGSILFTFTKGTGSADTSVYRNGTYIGFSSSSTYTDTSPTPAPATSTYKFGAKVGTCEDPGTSYTVSDNPYPADPPSVPITTPGPGTFPAPPTGATGLSYTIIGGGGGGGGGAGGDSQNARDGTGGDGGLAAIIATGSTVAGSGISYVIGAGGYRGSYGDGAPNVGDNRGRAGGNGTKGDDTVVLGTTSTGGAGGLGYDPGGKLDGTAGGDSTYGVGGGAGTYSNDSSGSDGNDAYGDRYGAGGGGGGGGSDSDTFGHDGGEGGYGANGQIIYQWHYP